MWKSVRNLLSKSGGSGAVAASVDDATLGRLWVSLIRLGVSRGLTLSDAEDLAQESIVAGMQSFDPARGDFRAFCSTILTNKALNLHRAARPQDPLPGDDKGLVDPAEGPAWALYRRQCRERTDRIVAETVSSLDDEAAAFFLVLAEVHGELSHGEVSEAARRAGFSPQQGWDVFRRIQRRFKGLEDAIPLPESPPSPRDRPCFLPKPILIPSDFEFSERGHLDLLRGKYERFKSGLESESRRRLNKLLRR